MEAQQVTPSVVATGVRFGLIVAVVGILLDFLLRIAGVSVLFYAIIIASIKIIVGIVGIILAHRAFRKANGNLLTIGQGVGIAVVMLLISSVLSVLFNYLYVHYVDPEFVERMKEQMTDFMERNNVPDSKTQESVAKLDELNPPLGMSLLKALGSGVIGGAIVGLLISLFTKRNPADFV